jgi:Fe-S-cluster containining protein
MIDVAHTRDLALQKQSAHKKFLATLKKVKNLDQLALETHTEVFAEIDCTACANCCKTLGPLWTEADILRVAKFMRLKISDFETTYLRVDEDGDKVFKNMPCPFLGSDNLCLIYEVRPKACREFPHTDRKKIYQINALTLKNETYCPAAYEFVERLKKKIEVK